MSSESELLDRLAQQMFYHEYLQLKELLPKSATGKACYRSRLYNLDFLQRLLRFYETLNPELLLFEDYLTNVESILPETGTPSLFDLIMFDSTPSLATMLWRRLLPSDCSCPDGLGWELLRRQYWLHKRSLSTPAEVLSPLMAAYQGRELEAFRSQLGQRPLVNDVVKIALEPLTEHTEPLQKALAGYLLSGFYRRHFTTEALLRALGELCSSTTKAELVLKVLMTTADKDSFWKEYLQPTDALQSSSLISPLLKLDTPLLKEALLFLMGLHSPQQLIATFECPFVEFERGYSLTVEILKIIAYRLHNLLPNEVALELVSAVCLRRCLPYEILHMLLRLGVLRPTAEHLLFVARSSTDNCWSHHQQSHYRSFKLLMETVPTSSYSPEKLLAAALDGGNEACLNHLWGAFQGRHYKLLSTAFVNWSHSHNVYKGSLTQANFRDPRYYASCPPQICSSYRWASTVGLVLPEQVMWLTNAESADSMVPAPTRFGVVFRRPSTEKVS